MKTTTTAARRLLREGNPVPGDAFPDAARDAEGQAVLAGILGSPAIAVADTPPAHRRAAALPGWPAVRTWKVAVPAGVMTAALAGLLAVMLTATGEPKPGVASPFTDSGFATLIANLTAHSSAKPNSAAAAELRALAAAAARQPTPVLGPVVYSKTQNWGLDLGKIHYGLGYRSHETNTEENWSGSDGSSLRLVTYPGGKIPPGIIPVNASPPSAEGKANYAKYGPASLPTTEPLMRQRLLQCRWGPCPFPDDTTSIVLNGVGLMGGELMPPAARAAILRVLADAAASPGPHQAFFNLGSVTDRAGHKAVAVGFEYQRYVSATANNDGCLGSESVSVSSSGAEVITCGGSASASATPSGAPSGALVPEGQPELWVLVFDPSTGAFVGEEFAYCSPPVSDHLATGKCTAASYAQLLQLKAVASVPPPPPGSTPNTPPVTGAAPASTGAS